MRFNIKNKYNNKKKLIHLENVHTVIFKKSLSVSILSNYNNCIIYVYIYM